MSHSRARVAALLLLGSTLVSVVCATEAPGNSMRGDAQLADIVFVDAEHGWAVGDRGVIWHTRDGGEKWELQASGVDCRLSSVHFIDAKTGWAAGGYTQPYTRSTVGVLLHTRDGGEHWLVDRKLLIPQIRKIKFFDAARGWAIAEASALFSSSVFTTEDGGRSWSSLPTPDEQSWLTGDFIDPLTGLLAGRNGALAAIRRKGIEPVRSTDFSLRAYRQVKLSSPTQGWLAGDGGLLLRSDDQGHTWQTPPGELPPGTREHFDFLTVETRGSSCWVAGAPGTRVLRSTDGGRTWDAHATGQTLPIRRLTFVDDHRGWAAGDLGTVIATRDGGRTWRKQRAGGGRAAYLAFFNEPTQAAWELLARLSADEGYLGVIETVNRQDLDAAAGSTSERAHEAAVRAGACAADQAWRFPLRQPGLKLSAEQLVTGWDRANDGQGLSKLEAHLVRMIRIWRPEVVFTCAAGANDDPRVQLLTQSLLRAVEQAANPAEHSKQISEAGLAAWKVQKVYGALPPGEHGVSSVNTSQMAGRLGKSLAELAAPARGLLEPRYTPPATEIAFRLLIDHIPQELGQRDFFSGISLSPGGEARRVLGEASDQSIDNLRRAAQGRRNLHAILNRAEERGADDGRWLGEIGELTRGMDEGSAAELLFQLAERYRQRGRPEMAAESFDLLAGRYPKHPLATASLVWLVQYYSSSEAGWRVAQRQKVNSREVNMRQASAIAKPSAGLHPVERAGGGRSTKTRNHTAIAQVQSLGDDRATRAANYAKQLEQSQPAMFAEPAVRFPLAAAHREQGLPRQAERFYLGLRRSRQHDAWWACAQGESWLEEPKGVGPKPIWTCRRAGSKPRLDGKLDDAVWRTSEKVELHSQQRDDADWPALAMLAYDDEFLYFAGSSRYASPARPTESAGPRSRDADLSRQDRLELLLDLDRDYASWYRLTVDHRGWTGESCWGDATWDPDWFVAAKSSDGAWTMEAAIPLSELSASPPQSKHVWAVGMQRTAPGVGFQSWTKPAAIEPVGEGFGYLIFE